MRNILDFLLILFSSFSTHSESSQNLLKIEQISGPLEVGEAPHWDIDQNLIYFVDIPRALIFRFDPDTRKTTHAKVEARYVSFILPVSGTDDQFVVGLEKDLSVLTWDGVSSKVPKTQIKTLFTSDTDCWKFNDGKCDGRGRVLAGTMGKRVKGGWQQNRGTLYSYSNGKTKVLIENVGISNGLAWTKDHQTFFYADSLSYTIDAFDYDLAKGIISNRRVIFELKKNNITGIADGMTIDRNDNLWVAINGGGCILHINPRTRKMLRKLQLPFQDVTSLVFAGENLDELIVTSSYENLSESEKTLMPQAGATFRITGLGVRGFKSINAVI